MQEFQTGHEDRVTVAQVNDDGSRILTASIDHRVKVWQRDRKTGARTLVDTFTAHDADIRDAKFIATSVGSYIGTVAADLKFQLWGEEVSQAHNSGRRFKLVASIPSTPRIPFASLDFKTVEYVYTYLALIDRQGLLSIYEPSSPDDLREWSLLEQFHVCTPVPGRGDETSFKVQWDPNTTPLSYMHSFSDEQHLGLLVSSLREVRIYHSNLEADTRPGGLLDSSTSQRTAFHEAFRIPTHPALIRGIAWSPYNIRGVERIATACKDGTVRIYELSLQAPQHDRHATEAATAGTLNGNRQPSRARPPAQSSLTSAITGRSSSHASGNGSPPGPPPFSFTYRIQHVSALPAHGEAWSVSWNPDGQILMSGGSDGVTKFWRKSVQNGRWMLCLEQSVEEEEVDE